MCYNLSHYHTSYEYRTPPKNQYNSKCCIHRQNISPTVTYWTCPGCPLTRMRGRASREQLTVHILKQKRCGWVGKHSRVFTNTKEDDHSFVRMSGDAYSNTAYFVTEPLVVLTNHNTQYTRAPTFDSKFKQPLWLPNVHCAGKPAKKRVAQQTRTGRLQSPIQVKKIVFKQCLFTNRL